MWLASVLLVACWSIPAHATPDATELQRNKATAMRVFDEIFNQRRLDVAREIYAPDFINHGLHQDHSLEEDQAAVRAELKAFPDLVMTVDRLVAEGDLVTAMWTLRGTHTAFGYGLPPTGTRIELRGITIWRIESGRIREEWTSFNALSAYLQVLQHVKWFLIGVLLVLGVLTFAIVRHRRVRKALQTDVPLNGGPKRAGL